MWGVVCGVCGVWCVVCGVWCVVWGVGCGGVGCGVCCASLTDLGAHLVMSTYRGGTVEGWAPEGG